MRVSLDWLHEWVRPKAAAAAIAEKLTLAGIEAEAEALPPAPAQVVVGRIVSVRPHPQADRLRVCEVDAGGERLTIVCGAANAREGQAFLVILLKDQSVLIVLETVIHRSVGRHDRQTVGQRLHRFLANLV